MSKKKTKGWPKNVHMVFAQVTWPLTADEMAYLKKHIGIYLGRCDHVFLRDRDADNAVLNAAAHTVLDRLAKRRAKQLHREIKQELDQ